MGMTGPLCGSAVFTGVLVFPLWPAFFGHLVVALWLNSRRVSPGSENILHKRVRWVLIQTPDDKHPRINWEVLFRWNQAFHGM